jgi:hypothetical protein
MKNNPNVLFSSGLGMLAPVSRFFLIGFLSFYGAAAVAQSKPLIIDDFDSYVDDGALHAAWNSFGTAAASGPPRTIATPEGGSLSVRFDLDWDAGDNANMRLAAVPVAARDLSDHDSIRVQLELLSDWASDTFPTERTKLKVAIEGGNDRTIWQTSNADAYDIPREVVSEAVFQLNEPEMVSIEGDSSLEETLKSIYTIRLRFENYSGESLREDVLVHQVLAQVDAPAPQGIPAVREVDRPSADEKEPQIGMWVWHVETIVDPQRRSELMYFCRKFGITRIFVQVDFEETPEGFQLANSAAWADTLAMAGQYGVEVEPLDGAGFMGFASQRETTLQKLDAVLAFHAAQPADARFYGVHYDIEPYTTARWRQGDVEAISIELLETLVAIRARVNAVDPNLIITHDIPFWYSGDPKYRVTFNGQTKTLDNHIQDLSDKVGIMSYRTQMAGYNSVTFISHEEMDYARKHGGQVYLCLETVPLEDTPHITFYGREPVEFADAIRDLLEMHEADPAFGGVFLHSYKTAKPLLEAWAETVENE